MDNNEFYELKLISASNQQAIENLTKLVQKTSEDIDKLVKTQTDILIKQSEIDGLKKEVKDLKDNQKWTVRSIIGGFITLGIGVLTAHFSK